jgi:hypothetical protein
MKDVQGNLLPPGRTLPKQPLVGRQGFRKPQRRLELMFVVGIDYQNMGS